ncbi:MAG TPA: ATP-dependent helicase, partial [Syntrophobacteraceae bacterium]|nr:ATP-dependent helicase [Syntrophobacteraceae bacterium]
NRSECRAAVESAHRLMLGGNENPHERWKFAEEKRRRDVDRDHPRWRGKNPELAGFIEAYEAELRRRDLIDFDDMPLLALRIIREHEWVRRSLRAKFPVLFVDEYQDLGHALHELVLLLCFNVGVRLFAVGDPDQSIYSFLGANPKLLENLSSRAEVRSIRLRFNYRCGTSIIHASMAALGEERDYCCPDDAEAGTIEFHGIKGELNAQADFVFASLLPSIRKCGTTMEQIGVLYRWATQGDEVAAKAMEYGIPIVRADNNALIKRSSRLSRFVEACANWVAGGWKEANPPFRRLAADAATLVLGPGATKEEQLQIQAQLICFLRSTIGCNMSTHEWLSAFRREALLPWRKRARTIVEDWDAIDLMIERTDPTKEAGNHLPLSHFGGRIEGSGRLNLSTLHSAKGREFDAVILFAMNRDVIPNSFERRSEAQLREARRQFYVGVTRARRHLYLVCNRESYSPFVAELYRRTQQPYT